MSSSESLAYIQLWTDDMVRLLFLTNESPLISGVRLRLWIIAASGKVGPIGVLPDDDEKLAHWGNVSLEQWKAMKQAIAGGWIEDEGNWVIRRHVEAAERRERVSAQASQKAKASWRKRRVEPSSDENRPGAAPAVQGQMPQQCRSNATADAPALLQQCSPSPSPSHSEKDSEKSLPPLPPPAAAEAFSASPPGRGTKTPEETEPLPASVASKRLRETPPGEPPPSPWLTPDQDSELATAQDILRDGYRDQWQSFEALVDQWRRCRTPWEPIRQALLSAMKNRPRDLYAYLIKIIRVEVPNYHEREAIARHEQRKAEEARERDGLRVDRGMETVGAILANLAQRSTSSEEVE